ncbi:hypothetical protein [Streptomyces sp. NPDC059008]|uniref:hypothetical protein n=1 Tax=Streptomyces sp. NPDC059008 TaxID=3346693 RepID=UPI0036C1C2C8
MQFERNPSDDHPLSPRRRKIWLVVIGVVVLTSVAWVQPQYIEALGTWAAVIIAAMTAPAQRPPVWRRRGLSIIGSPA